MDVLARTSSRDYFNQELITLVFVSMLTFYLVFVDDFIIKGFMLLGVLATHFPLVVFQQETKTQPVVIVSISFLFLYVIGEGFERQITKNCGQSSNL